MHPNDLVQFRDNVAHPRMMQLFEKTQIEDGTCFIDRLDIALLDGRNCGFDNHVFASGVLYRGGAAEKFVFDECDVDLNDFFAEHDHCVFVSDGELRVEDELAEMDLHTRIRNILNCEKFFSWFVKPSSINIEMVSIQYEKLKYLLEKQKTEEKPALDALVTAAAGQKDGHGNPSPSREWESIR